MPAIEKVRLLEGVLIVRQDLTDHGDEVSYFRLESGVDWRTLAVGDERNLFGHSQLASS